MMKRKQEGQLTDEIKHQEVRRTETKRWELSQIREEKKNAQDDGRNDESEQERGLPSVHKMKQCEARRNEGRKDSRLIEMQHWEAG